MWTCKCGRTNEAPLCSKCGSRQPTDAETDIVADPAAGAKSVKGGSILKWVSDLDKVSRFKAIFTLIMMVLILICLFLPIIQVDLLFQSSDANIFELGDFLSDVGSTYQIESASTMGYLSFLFYLIPVLEAVCLFGLITRRTQFAFRWGKITYTFTLACTLMFYGIVIAISGKIAQTGGELLTNAISDIISLKMGIFLLTALSIIGLLADLLIKQLLPATSLPTPARRVGSDREPVRAKAEPMSKRPTKAEIPTYDIPAVTPAPVEIAPKAEVAPAPVEIAPKAVVTSAPVEAMTADIPAPASKLKTTIGAKPVKRATDTDSYFKRPDDL